MYFLTALICAIIAGVLWFFFRKRKGLHLEVLTIIYGASALMWLIDCIFSASQGEPFLSFEKTDGWIALATFGCGLFFWLLISFILNNKKEVND